MSDRRFIAWIHHTAIAIGRTVEEVLADAAIAQADERWKLIEGERPHAVDVTTYGTQRLILDGGICDCGRR